MKKGLKAIIAIGVILVVVGATVGGLVGFAERINDTTSPQEELSTWMSYIDSDVLLKNVVIPGAHDAGTAGMLYVSETQSRTINELLACGVRYFDLRVREKNGKLLMYHGPVNGTDLDSVMTALKTFVTEHPTETLIVDFQHFDNAKEQVVAKVEREWQDVMVRNDTEKDDVTFIDELTLVVIRGKIVTFIGEDDGTESAKAWFFKRNDDEGKKKDCPIQSLYDEKAHKGNQKAFMLETLPKYIEAYKTNPRGLFVLQCQLTDGMLFLGPKFRESQVEEEMDQYVDSLKDSKDLIYINVIMRDYLSPSKCTSIIVLNRAKGTVDAEKVSDFEKAFMTIAH